jgi:BirA family biotin operon repressor/biotin-[acetyl-CoA-carboxylase] ligase
MDMALMGIELARSPMVALAVGLAAVDAVTPLLPVHTVGLHWPNDVYACGRKLAGILIEVLPNGLWVIGMGLNTNSTIDDAPPELRHTAITLRDLTGSRHDQTSVLVAYLRHFEKYLRQLRVSPDQIGRKADSLCLQHGCAITVDVGLRRISGTCVGIATDGALVVDTPEGQQRFYSGTICHENGRAPLSRPASTKDAQPR